MKNFIGYLIVALTVIVSSNGQNLELGNFNKLPHVQAQTLMDEPFFLDEFSDGKTLLLVIWGARYHYPSKKQLEKIHVVFQDWKKETGVTLLFLAYDGCLASTAYSGYDSVTIAHLERDSLSAYVSRNSFDYEIAMIYNCKQISGNMPKFPLTWIVDKNNIIRWQMDGYRPGDEKNYIEVLRKLIQEK